MTFTRDKAMAVFDQLGNEDLEGVDPWRVVEIARERIIREFILAAALQAVPQGSETDNGEGSLAAPEASEELPSSEAARVAVQHPADFFMQAATPGGVPAVVESPVHSTTVARFDTTDQAEWAVRKINRRIEGAYIAGQFAATHPDPKPGETGGDGPKWKPVTESITPMPNIAFTLSAEAVTEAESGGGVSPVGPAAQPSPQPGERDAIISQIECLMEAEGIPLQQTFNIDYAVDEIAKRLHAFREGTATRGQDADVDATSDAGEDVSPTDKPTHDCAKSGCAYGKGPCHDSPTPGASE